MVTQAEMKRRQEKAKELNRQLRSVVEHDARLREETSLLLWHGTLVLGRGGEVYDFDYAVFAKHDHCADLLGFVKHLSKCVDGEISNLTWRNDAHFDGFSMFEAHTHWDLKEDGFPHVGVHVCSNRALDELLGSRECQSEIGFTRAIDAWIRYGVLLRNWVYEGVPVYDPTNAWAALKDLDTKPPEWLLDELRSVVCHAGMYRPQQDGREPCFEGEPRALELVAVLAYAIEGMPLGRKKRREGDLPAMKNPLARALLGAANDGDLHRARQLLL